MLIINSRWAISDDDDICVTIYKLSDPQKNPRKEKKEEGSWFAHSYYPSYTLAMERLIELDISETKSEEFQDIIDRIENLKKEVRECLNTLSHQLKSRQNSGESSKPLRRKRVSVSKPS